MALYGLSCGILKILFNTNMLQKRRLSVFLSQQKICNGKQQRHNNDQSDI